MTFKFTQLLFLADSDIMYYMSYNVVCLCAGTWDHTTCKYIQYSPDRTPLWEPDVTCRGRSVKYMSFIVHIVLCRKGAKI